jgi:hypothetical protein
VERHQNRPQPDDLEEYHVTSTYTPRVTPQEDVLAQGWRALRGWQRQRGPRAAIATAETLDQAIIRLSHQGFVVVFRTEKQAQLIRKKRLNWLAVIGHCIGTAGITLIPYLLDYARQADKIVTLTADEAGRVQEA